MGFPVRGDSAHRSQAETSWQKEAGGAPALRSCGREAEQKTGLERKGQVPGTARGSSFRNPPRCGLPTPGGHKAQHVGSPPQLLLLGMPHPLACTRCAGGLQSPYRHTWLLTFLSCGTPW